MTYEVDDMVKILRINAYIQRGMGEVSLDEKKVVCVALDRTCAFEDEYDAEQLLSDAQLNNLFHQTFGFLKQEGE
ncbi:MAG TPA: hypothetical protein VKU38_03690 [Ktedonobacteraceae bacterium]|nr:hypothetical protein [Ktedonobacteraceae bacterium]